MENKLKIRELPSIKQSLIFRGKAFLLQNKRAAENAFDSQLKTVSFADQLFEKPIIAESKTDLWTESEPEEKFLVAGKIQNLRIAVKKLNGLEIAANQLFSFWKQVGKASKFNGYVVGRELREGCIIPNVGGGLCQISNALYDAALKANFEIVERHAHTQIVAGSLAETGRDATVFWNYVDLRFRSPNAFRIEAGLDAEQLIVRFRGEIQTEKQIFQITKRGEKSNAHPNSCATCGEESCFRVVKPEKNLNFGKTAFLVDEFSPEFDEYIQKIRTKTDSLFVPLDGKRYKKDNYAWETNGFSSVRQSLPTTLIRAYKSRKLAAQGAQRQKNLLEMAEKLAKSYTKNLRFDVLHVVVSQNILPFLWREGVLGGRTFDALMTNLPISELQKRLDFAYSLNPESNTLGDFRAENWLVKAETEALAAARKIITPHSEIASLFSDRAELLEWNLPKSKNHRPKTKNPKPIIAFPASTVGRKGAYELREAITGLDVKLLTFGANIEGEDFWSGFDTERGNFQNGWLEKADLVVLPSYLETKPRRILEAAANQIPVIASNACGVENIASVEIVPFGDAAKLKSKITRLLKDI